MSDAYAFVADLAAEVQIPDDGTLSRTLHNDDQIKVLLFAFSAGQELSEHTASMPAILHIVKGEGDLTLGADTKSVSPGAWAHMAANLPHSVRAATPLIMLLILLKQPS